MVKSSSWFELSWERTSYFERNMVLTNSDKEQDTKPVDRFEDEKILWMRCGQNDEAAREELILAYRPMVYWLAKSLRVPYNTYPDLIQEGMVALISAVDSFDISRNNRFSTFAYYKIRGRMINFLQRVEAKAPIPVDDAVFAEEAAKAVSVSAAAERSEWTIDLQKAMDRLSQRESDIIRALILEGEGAKDVAEKKTIDVSHVYRIRRKALEKLRKWLVQDENATTSM